MDNLIVGAAVTCVCVRCTSMSSVRVLMQTYRLVQPCILILYFSSCPSLGHRQSFQTVHDNHCPDAIQPEKIKADQQPSPQTPSFLTGSKCLLLVSVHFFLQPLMQAISEHVSHKTGVCLLCGLLNWHVCWPDAIFIALSTAYGTYYSWRSWHTWAENY